jgi:tetratricopeptide (TPR) repeat protein
VTSSFRFRPAAFVAVIALVLTGAGNVVAQVQESQPQPQLLSTYQRSSVSGSYLAARHATVERDAAGAAAHYRSALRGDPKNNELLSRAFLAVLANGEMEEAIRLADRLLQADKNDRIARLVLGVRAIKQKQYPVARQQLAQSIRGPITDLAATLLSAWTYAGAAESKAGIDAIDKLTGPDWYALFKDLHAGLILDASNQRPAAGKRFERAYKLDATALRVVQGYGSWLTRQGRRDEAAKVYGTFDEALPRHPLIVEAMDSIKANRRIAPLADNPQTGAAEVLYGLGAALGRRGGEDLALIYLQLALYLQPGHQMALLSLADVYETVKKPELAIKTYERMPAGSSLQRNAQIQRALNLDSLDRTDEARSQLEKIIADDPLDREATMALGNVLRGRKLYAECADVYSKTIASIAKPDKPHWIVFYFRGICNERSKQWEKAEGDLKKALELAPDHSDVLNYLGYSWIDQGVNLDDGMRMIQRAVEQRPDNGYIVDSLGWAHFRVGNFEEAVKHLERAVELKPEDPTINDHLGDAYWKVGRLLEAQFQWAHARDLKPEADELAKIEEKLKSGLTEDTSSAAAAAQKAKRPNGG